MVHTRRQAQVVTVRCSECPLALAVGSRPHENTTKHARQAAVVGKRDLEPRGLRASHEFTAGVAGTRA